MFWNRLLAAEFHRLRGLFPAVLVTGPRQSGKTTFLRHEAPDCAFVSFDDPLQRQFASLDPNGFLGQFDPGPVILDEVQYVPELFSYLKLQIDAQRSRHGRFLMSGSQQFQLMKHVSDSLAGRIAILDLFPFAFIEIEGRADLDIAELIWRGGYPPVAVEPARRDPWLSAYVQTYVERDVRQLQGVKDLRAFETFLALCAGRHGQELNLAEMGRQAGVTQPTAKAWISVLEASYVVWLLPPYFRNFGKRLVKAPKAYFVDSALAAHLTRQPDAQALWHGAMGGAFFEGWVVMETVKAFAARGQRPPLYYWRSNDGLEVDLLVESGGRLHAVEIKRTATPLPGHARGLLRFQQLVGEKTCGGQCLVCNVDRTTLLPGGVQAIPWRKYSGWISERVK